MRTKSKKEIKNYDFGQYFTSISKLMFYLGIEINFSNNLEIKTSKTCGKFHLPILSFLLLGIFSALGELCYTIDMIEQDDLYMAGQVASHLLSNIICVAKGFRLLFTLVEIENVSQKLSKLWKKHLTDHAIRKLITKRARNTLIFCKIFMYVTVSSVATFCLRPIRNVYNEYLHRNDNDYNHNYEQRNLFVKYPFEINSFSKYISVMIGELYLLIGAGMMWVASDVIFAQLTTHISLQLKILQHDMKSLINNEKNIKVLKKNLIVIIKRHQDLLRICSQLERIFSPVILSTILLSGINLCFNVFATDETISRGRVADALVHFSLFTITILQIIFYCGFAEALTEQTRSLADTIYTSNWTEKSKTLRTYMQILIIRAQNPFYCTAYRLFPIGHVRLTMVLNTAYTYYMILHTTTKKMKKWRFSKEFLQRE